MQRRTLTFAGAAGHGHIAGAVALGAVVGAATRWALIELLGGDGTVPPGLVVANVVGCLVLAMVVALAPEAPAPRSAAIGTGFCGALTTFSTLAVDLARLGDDGDIAGFVVLLAVSLLTGVLAHLVGDRLARHPRVASTRTHPGSGS